MKDFIAFLKECWFPLLMILMVILSCVVMIMGVADGSRYRGRVDVASGRFTATQIINKDGLTEWKFTEINKP